VEAAERTIRVDGVTLRVREWAGGRGRPVLLLHGLASTSHTWDLVASRLTRAGLRAVAYDQRGHGASGKPTSGYGFARMTADAAAVMRRLRLDRPVVVGASWGANVALELAVRRPRSVRGLVLVDGGIANLGDRMDWPTTREALAPPHYAGMPLERFLALFRREYGVHMQVTPAVEATILPEIRVDHDGGVHPRLTRANHLRILRALWEQDTQGLLRRVRVPTLALAARSRRRSTHWDGFAEAKRRAAVAVRAIGDPVRFEWMEGIHDLALQRPEAVARRIVRAARS
jgi:pimeloyl-ACP methyl ester carboxylesterase